MSGLGYSVYGVYSSGELIYIKSIFDSIAETFSLFVHPGSKRAWAMRAFLLVEPSKPHSFCLK